MANRQVTAFTRTLDAVNAGDAKSYASLYAQDAVITIHGSGQLEGRGAIEQHEVELLREFPGVRLGFYAIWQTGPLAVVHYAVNGKARGGPSMGHEGLLFYRFHPSGLIEEERRYLDSLTPMAQLGLLGALPARGLPTLPTELKVNTARGSPDEEENVAAACWQRPPRSVSRHRQSRSSSKPCRRSRSSPGNGRVTAGSWIPRASATSSIPVRSSRAAP